ncbi:MAG: DUF1841 family protein [Neisseriaceae bacterium]
MFDINSAEVRRFFAKVWARRFDLHLSPMEQKVLKIISAHPEYYSYLEEVEKYIERVWTGSEAQSNPFLHISLHLSLQEQISIDQPPGIALIHTRLIERTGGWHAAEHKMMDALTDMIWKAQLHGRGFDVNEYITTLRKLIQLGPEENPRLNPHEVG